MLFFRICKQIVILLVDFSRVVLREHIIRQGGTCTGNKLVIIRSKNKDCGIVSINAMPIIFTRQKGRGERLERRRPQHQVNHANFRPELKYAGIANRSEFIQVTV